MSFPGAHRVFLKERFNTFILNFSSGRNAKVLAAFMAVIGTLKVRNQVVNIINIH